MANETPLYPEQDPTDQSLYELSVRQMLDMAATRESAVLPTYYATRWDEQEPSRIDDIIVAITFPTGARRHLRWGIFYDAQFRVSETSWTTGERREQFIWGYTGPQREGEPIRLDEQTFTSNYGYKSLTRPNVVNELRERADSVDEYIVLLEVLRERGIQPTVQMATDINRYIYRLANKGFASYEDADDQLDSGKALKLIGAWQALDSPVGREPQSHLLSLLLKSIAIQGRNSTPQRMTAANNAAGILKLALEEGIVPKDPILMKRLLAVPSIYRYRFATDLLHEQFGRLYKRQYLKNIFGTDRLNFIHDYLTEALQSGETGHESVKQFLRSNHPMRHDRLYILLNNLQYMVSSAEKHRTIPQVGDVHGVEPALKCILSNMHGDREPDFDRKCTEIVHAIIKPLVYPLRLDNQEPQ